MNNLDRTAAENARHIVALLHVEASKWLRTYYKLCDKSYDYEVMYLGLEQVMLNFAERLENEKV